MSGSPPAATTPRRAAMLIGFMWLAYFLNYCDRQAVFAMFPSLKSGLGMTDRQLGLTGSAFLWVYALGCPLAGMLADRGSKRVLVVLSLVLWSLVTIATGLATSAVMLLGLRAAMGLSEALFMPTAIALTANAHPTSRRSRAIALLTTAQIAGTVAGSWFGGWMADRGQWRGAFFVLGAIGLLYALPYSGFLRAIREGAAPAVPSRSAWPDVGRVLGLATFWTLCLVFSVFVFGLWLIYGWLPALLHEKFSLNQSDAAFNATLFLQTAAAAGLVTGGWLADALLRRTHAARLWVMVASLLLSAPCLHALGASETLIGVRCAAVGFGFFSGLLMGNIFPAAFEVVPADARSSTVGLLNLFGGLVSGVATLSGGLWKASLGIRGLMTFTAIAYALAAAALALDIRLWFSKDQAGNR
ncbi:MAG: MFS transporter [Verrucomicrobia bacterium]|nr:MFS transporter [Verrucomicrobiota bacterium]